MKRITWILFFLTLLIDSCIDPIDVRIKSASRRIVVDGMITNEPGPHRVFLSYSQDVGAPSKQVTPLTGAQLAIIEDDQQVQTLTELFPGQYFTDTTWSATIGKTYQLRFTTSSNNEYRSVPQVLTNPGSLDSLYVRFKANSIMYGNDGSLLQDAINVYVDATSSPGSSGRFRWRFTGMFHARTYPELMILDLPGGPIPNPPECSGWVYENGELYQVAECTCCDCYPYDLNTALSISAGQFTGKGTFKEVLVTRIPATPLRFYNKYYIEMEQHSISEEVYTFWQLVKSLQESAGSIFQPNAVKVRGNIDAIGSDEEVLGIFAVSGVVKKELFLDSLVIPYSFKPEILAEECANVFIDATYDKPSFWP